MINPVSKVIGGGTDEFTRPADVTVYTAGDRVSATTSDTATTPLRTLFRATKQGADGIITKLILQTNLATFIDIMRIHLFQVSQPATAIPGDNAAMGVVFANRAEYLGFFDFAALAEPIAISVSDLSQAILSEKKIGFRCKDGDDAIYYALQTTGTGTPASGQQFFLRAETEE